MRPASTAKSGIAEGVEAPDFTPFHCAVIVGVGLMGGSLGMALRTRHLADRVVGVDRSAALLEEACRLGVIDQGTVDLQHAVAEADAIFLATPVSIIVSLLESIAAQARPEAIVTDLGSVKGEISVEGERLLGPRFVGGHPMCGSERSGVLASRPDLFREAAWVLVPPCSRTAEAQRSLARLSALVRALGARPLFLDAPGHDRLAALTSHLPHLLAFAFAQTIAEDPECDLARDLAGGSYRDFSRIAAADRTLWHDIFLANRSALQAALTTYKNVLESLERSLL